jgi:hypothetical protein
MNARRQHVDEDGNGFTITVPANLVEAFSEQIAERVIEKISTASQSASPWMDVAGVAAYAVMTEQAVRDAEKNKHLRAYRTMTGRLRFHRDDVEAFMKGTTR